MATTLHERRDEMVDRLRAELRRRVRESGATQRSLEEANGFARGYLSQVLQGHVTLTARHVFGILLALEVPADEFFARLLGDRRRSSPDVSEIRERMAVYDAALEQLERKGLLTRDPDDPSD
jgi:transcriptional regulator with XRE-family HTH domain